MGEGHGPTVGASSSTTVTVKVHVPVLPAASVAEQVTVVVPNAKVEPDAGEHVGVKAPSQLSVAVAVKLTTAVQTPVSVPCVMLDGHVTTGASVSVMVTVKAHVAVLPEASVAVQVTVVVPTAKQVPEAGEQLTVTPGQLSVAVATNVSTEQHIPGSVVPVMGLGHVTVGASVSLTVTVKVHMPTLPAASVAEQVTVVVPTGKAEPDAGEQVTAPTPGQLSVAGGVV
jgi:hypothetical protein